MLRLLPNTAIPPYALSLVTKAREKALGEAERAAELVIARYEAGSIDYLDFLDADRSRLEQERKLSQRES